jgi:hypothetical protein
VSRELGTLLEGGGEETIQAVALVAERLGSRARAVLPGLVAAALRIDKLESETPLARSLGVFGEEAAALILKKLAEPDAPEDTERLMLALRFTASTSVEILRDALKRGPAPARLGAAPPESRAARRCRSSWGGSKMPIPSCGPSASGRWPRLGSRRRNTPRLFSSSSKIPMRRFGRPLFPPPGKWKKTSAHGSCRS